MAFDRRMRFAGLILTAMLFPPVISSRRYDGDKDSESLNFGQRFYIFANVVRPLGATCERYPYFDFPFCPPDEQEINRTRTFDDLLTGDCHTNTRFELRFRMHENRKTLCDRSLTKSEVARFRNAIKRKFVYQLAYRKGSILGEVGRIIEEDHQKPKYYLATHTNFYIEYYGNQVVDVLTGRDPETEIDITKVSKLNVVRFTYSVFWVKTKRANPFGVAGRTVRIRDDERLRFLLLDWSSTILIWLSVISFVNLPYILSYLSCYWQEYSDVELSLGSRYIHGENCNCPQYTSLLGAILGNGTQLLIMVCVFFALAHNGLLRPCNLRLLCSDIARVYCILSALAGYIGSSFHTRFTRVGWKEGIFQTATIYMVPVLLTTLLANQMAVTVSAALVLDHDIIIENVLWWGVPSTFLLSLGGVIARRLRRNPRPPCSATRPLSREIPPRWGSWFASFPAQVLLGGLIPSAAIFSEMDKIYASLWRFKVCGAFATLLVAFTTLVVLTVLLAVGFTSFQLSRHDRRWWWKSVYRGGSPAVFVFGYGIYFLSRANLDHGAQIRVLGYNACLSYALFLVLGTISFYASSLVHCTFNNLQKYE